MPIYYGPAALVLAQADQMGYDPIFLGGDGMDGLMDAGGKRVPVVYNLRDALKLVNAATPGGLSKGGMDSKLKAAQNAAKSGANVVMASGARPKVLEGIFAGKDIGTFMPGAAL